MCGRAHRDAPLRLPPTAITGVRLVLTADSILARSTGRRQTSTGWNTVYIGANRHTLPPDKKHPADDALCPMAFLVEKGPGAVTRPHFHQADQFQVVIAGRGMLGDHEFSDGAVHYTDAYSAYGRAPSAGGGQFWLVLTGDAAVDGGGPLPANSCIFVGPEDPAFAGASIPPVTAASPSAEVG